MQNKANFQKAKMNVNAYYRKDYGQILWDWSQEKQTQSNPIQGKTNPICLEGENDRKLFCKK